MVAKINNSPTLTMAERTKQIFNNSFLSDVQFFVDGRIIHAHSLPLMLCSIVFQKQLESALGEKKLIAINDASYQSVYEFLRFIYTDEFHADNTNVIDILKLSKRYKVIKLENEVFSFIFGDGLFLKLYEYCLLEDDQHHLRRAQSSIFLNLNKILATEQFLTINPRVIQEIFNSDHANVPEVQLFQALTRWIDQNSKDNKIPATEQAIHYKNYVHLIRFPIMTADEFKECVNSHSHLFNDATISNALGRPSTDGCFWNSSVRKACIFPYKYKTIDNFDTQLTVTHKMLLTGLRFGRTIADGIMRITITQNNCAGQLVEQINFDCKPNKWNSIVFSLGESIQLEPTFEYTIGIKLIQKGVSLKSPMFFSRKKNTDIIINVPSNLIQFNKVCRNILELYFKLVE